MARLQASNGPTMRRSYLCCKVKMVFDPASRLTYCSSPAKGCDLSMTRAHLSVEGATAAPWKQHSWTNANDLVDLGKEISSAHQLLASEGRNMIKQTCSLGTSILFHGLILENLNGRVHSKLRKDFYSCLRVKQLSCGLPCGSYGENGSRAQRKLPTACFECL